MIERTQFPIIFSVPLLHDFRVCTLKTFNWHNNSNTIGDYSQWVSLRLFLPDMDNIGRTISSSQVERGLLMIAV